MIKNWRVSAVLAGLMLSGAVAVPYVRAEMIELAQTTSGCDGQAQASSKSAVVRFDAIGPGPFTMAGSSSAAQRPSCSSSKP